MAVIREFQGREKGDEGLKIRFPGQIVEWSDGRNCKKQICSIFNMNLEFTIQPSPDGLAQAFIFGKELMGVRQNSLFEENVAYDSYFAAFGIGRMSIRPSLVGTKQSVNI